MRKIPYIVLIALATAFSCGKVDQPSSESVASVELTSPENVSIPAEGGQVPVTFKASGNWMASFTDAQDPSWLSLNPKNGKKDGSITLLATPNTGETERKASIRIACGTAMAYVNVTQGVYSSSLVFYEDMDKDPSYYGWMSEGTWHNATGDGAANVSYSSFNASIRNDNYGSAGAYTGASGKCYGRLTQAASGNFGYLTISGISTGGKKDFVLSFGAAQGPEVLKVEVCPSGMGWTQLPYTFGQQYNHWGLASTTFSLNTDIQSIDVRFTLVGEKSAYAYGANIDDIKLETTNESSDNLVGEKWPYAELPVTQNNADYYYNTLHTTTVKTNKQVRNYSFCYDTRRHNPIWVAFPMHGIYAEGSGRSKDEYGNDPWMQYPGLPVEKQSIIWNIGGDGYQYWSMTNGYSFTKGHLCMSSSRAGANQEINLQTFYPVNIAPQTNGLFATLWGKTEDFHWQGGTQICSDTLYVVAGCYYANDNTVEYDACEWNDHSSYSKPCIMPTHQYKLFLRTRSGNLGKPVQKCQASELKTIGFWFKEKITDGNSDNLADYAMSVAEIESLTGITFFPDIPTAVKEQCSPSDWGL